MTADAADVVIIGGGLEGCAAAWALTRRGITDITIVERDTVGSGGTGKSSGVVRCHYGVSSLAAMATRSLETFENAEDVLGADVGFHQTGYVVGVGPENVDALHASVADQRAVGVRTEDIDHTDVRKLWPVADLEPFAAFAWEERGGYGDAYQTAQAFAGAARRAGARLRQGTTATAIRTSGDRVTGVELADGTVIATEHVVLAAGPWSVGLLAAHGIELPITPHREQIVLVDPGQDLGPVPVFSDLVSLQYIRPEGAGNAAVRQLRPVDPRAGRPRPVLEPGDVVVRRPDRGEGRRPPARPGEPGDRRELRRLLRRHARLQPGHLGRPRWTGSSSPPASRGTATRFRRPSGGSSPTSSSTARAPTPTSPPGTSGSPASPRATCSGAPTPTSAPARCAEDGDPRWTS